MIKHQMKITVRRPGQKPISIAKFRKLSLIKRLALKWFGGVERVMVIVPEKSVQTVEIKEEESNESINDTNQSKTIEHQKRAFEFAMGKFENGEGVALLLEMGCGKSLISVALAGALFNERRIRNLLIVCPLSICGVWEEEFSKFADFEYNLKVLKGSLEKKTETLYSLEGRALQIAVVNYESVWRIERQIKNWYPDMIICDESHKIKSHNIAASKSLHKLGEKTCYKMILTGTAITNKAIDIFSQYKFLEPRIFGKSFYTFRNHYFDMVGYGLHTPVLKE